MVKKSPVRGDNSNNKISIHSGSVAKEYYVDNVPRERYQLLVLRLTTSKHLL